VNNATTLDVSLTERPTTMARRAWASARRANWADGARFSPSGEVKRECAWAGAEELAQHGSIFLIPFLFPVFLLVVLNFKSKLNSNLSL
jgi:hypothetical protein